MNHALDTLDRLPPTALQRVLEASGVTYEDLLDVPVLAARAVLTYHALRMTQYRVGALDTDWPELPLAAIAMASEALMDSDVRVEDGRSPRALDHAIGPAVVH